MRHILPALFLLAFSLPTAAQDNPVIRQIKAFQTAFNAGDAETLSAFYTEDGALFPPRAGTVLGRAAIADHYARAFDSGVSGLRINLLELRQHGPETAIEIGETTVDTATLRIHGRYLHVWTRDAGTWRLSRDIFNVIGTEAR